MSRFLTSAAAMLALVAGGTSAVLADSPVELARALDGAKLTLDKAITAAETSSKGHALSTSTSMDGKNVAVNVFCISGDKVMLVPVDHTGKAGAAKAATPDQEKAANITTASATQKAMTDNKMQLAKAIQAAEKESRGTATSSYASATDGKLTFHVTTVADGKPLQVSVDGKTGKASIAGKKEPSSARRSPHKP